MKGQARAWGGISVVNAIAAGRGASAAVDLATTATVHLVEDDPDVHVTIHGDAAEDPGLAQAVVRRVLALADRSGWGARVETESTIPIGRGLKSSSAAANAIGLATATAVEEAGPHPVPRSEVLEAAVDAALEAGVTITGAYDDACASFYGGVCVTDNTNRQLLHRYGVPESDDLVALIHVPDRKTHTQNVRDRPYRAIRRVAERAHGLAVEGAWLDAMTLNGLAYGPVYGIDPSPLLAALQRGARAASVSGTGPALAAVAARADADHVAQAFKDVPGRTLTVDFVNEGAEVLA